MAIEMVGAAASKCRGADAIRGRTGEPPGSTATDGVLDDGGNDSDHGEANESEGSCSGDRVLGGATKRVRDCWQKHEI